MVFKLLRQSCKCGLYSHAGAALPALLPPCRSGRGKGKKANQNNSTRHGVTLRSTSVCCTAVITQGTTLESSNLAMGIGKSPALLLLHK